MMKLIKGVNAPSIMFLVGLTLLPILSLLGFLKALFPLPLFLLAASAFIAFLSKRGSAEESLKKTLLALSSISLLLLLFFAFTAKAAVITEYNLPPGSAPISLVLDNRSYVWFTEYGSNRIGRLIPGNIAPYEIREFKLPLGSKPWGIAYEDSTKRRIWFTEYSRHKIGVITEVNGEWYLTEFSLFNDAGPRGIAIEPNYEGTDTARIWFTEFNTGSIGALYLNTTFNGAPNVVYEWFLPDSNSQPLSIIYVNGKVWFTEYQGDRIGCIELIDGGGNEILLREWPLISGSRPWGISNDTYGNIWVTLSGRNRIAKLNPYTNEITEYLIPTPGSGPRGIIVDPFNNVWFAEHNVNKIGRLSPGSNVIVEFELASSAPTGITYAKFDPEPPTENGKIWFTDEDGDMLGRIDPTKAITTATVSTIARALTSSSTATTVGSSTAITTADNTLTSSATFVSPNNMTAMTMTSTSYTVSETSKVLKTSSVATSTTYVVQSATTTYTSTSYYTTVTTATSVTYTMVETETETSTTTLATVLTSYVATVTTTKTMTHTLTTTTTVTTLPLTFQIPASLSGGQANPAAGPLLGVAALTFIGFTNFPRKFKKVPLRKLMAVLGAAMVLALLASNSANASVITEWSLPPDSTDPYEITFDDQSPYRVWFTEHSGNKIGRLNPATGEIFEIKLPSGSAPWGIAFETARKEIWFTMLGRNRIGVVSDYGAGSVLEFELPEVYAAGPKGITVQGHVNGTDYPYIWFAYFGADKIGRLDPYYRGTITYWDLEPNSAPQSIIFVKDTGVWFTAYEGRYIGNLNPATGEIKKWEISSRPWDLAVDAFGNIWFTDAEEDRIGRLNPYSSELVFYSLPEAFSKPYSIAVDAQGFVWFAENGKNRIGRFSPDDLTFVEFERGASGAPWGLAISQDGKIWFTETVASKICRLDPSMALTTITVTQISTASKTTTTTLPFTTGAASYTTATMVNDVATTLTTTPALTTTTYGVTETVRVLQVTGTSTETVYSTDTLIVLGTSTVYSPTTVSTTTTTTTKTKVATFVSTTISPATKTSTKTVWTNVTLTITETTVPPIVIPGYQPFAIAIGLISGVASLLAIKVYRRSKHKT